MGESTRPRQVDTRSLCIWSPWLRLATQSALVGLRSGDRLLGRLLRVDAIYVHPIGREKGFRHASYAAYGKLDLTRAFLVFFHSSAL